MESFPNPSADHIHIRYRVADRMKVTLKIYDVTGKVVATPVNNETRNAGSYDLNYSTANLSNGVYYATLANNGQTVQSLKLSVTK